MQTCPSCQRSVADDAVVCAGCGLALSTGTMRVEDALSDTLRSPRRATSARGATAAASASAVRLAETETDEETDEDSEPEPAPESRAETEVAPSLELESSVLDGRYDIIRKIGEGGMGAVFEARHSVIGKRVAIKILLDKYVTKPDVVARLLQEARNASAIGHENIIDITDFGATSDGRTFVVMEFLDGESLHDLLVREGCLPPSRAIAIARQTASALGAAHEKGIIHRDIKPENVFIIRRAERDFVKVVDFGISKALKADDEISVSPRLTTTGMILGTPLYLSPEQARGEDDLDRRIDVYALGVVLYEMLTGEVPFHGANYLSIISQILEKDARPPSQLRGDLGLSEDLDAVIARAMAKGKTERYQNMAELDADLARLEGGLAPRARTDPPIGPAPRRWPQIAGWVVGLGLIGLAVALAVPRLLSDSDLRVTPPPAPVATTPPPTPAPPPVAPAVQVTVTSDPPGAAIWWESVAKGVTPRVLELSRSDRAIELTLKLDGYEDAKAIVFPTRDQELPVTMTPRPPPPRPVRRAPARAPSRPEPDPGPTSGGEIKPSPYAK